MAIFKHLLTIENSKVRFLEADSNYTVLHLYKGEKLLSSFTLKEHQEYFPKFIRVNRKIAINPSQVKRVDIPNKKVIIRSGKSFVLSRRRLKEVCSLLIQS